jgi:hypothetical protein
MEVDKERAGERAGGERTEALERVEMVSMQEEKEKGMGWGGLVEGMRMWGGSMGMRLRCAAAKPSVSLLPKNPFSIPVSRHLAQPSHLSC